MKTLKFYFTSLVIIALSYSCNEETRNEMTKAKESISNATKVVNKSKGLQKEYGRLKEVTPMTNDELKSWLPQNLGSMARSGFKVGAVAYMNVSSIDGTYKDADNDKEFKVQIIDGAGPIGSSLIMGLSMVHKVEMEEEDENKHTKSVTKNDIVGRQTYFKKRNDTKFEFLYDDRFSVKVDSKNLSTEETWKLLDELDLKELSAKTD